MAAKRQLELHLLRFMPHPLRDDFVTVGLLLLESDAGFAEFRFTRDWRMLQCVAPDVQVEWFQMVESEIRGSLQKVRSGEELAQLVAEKFGAIVEVGPTKAVLTEDPLKEMEILASMYLAPPDHSARVQPLSRRAVIVETMSDAFENAGVLELMKRNINVDKYTGQGDPFRIDFGYRIGNVIKMFHAVSLPANVDQALALGSRYSRVQAGMRLELLEASLTAVVDRELEIQDERARFALGMLKSNEVRVNSVSEMAEIADAVRREFGM